MYAACGGEREGGKVSGDTPDPGRRTASPCTPCSTVTIIHWMSMRLKRFKIGIHEICAFCLIIFATVLRVILISQGWPETDSDEGTMGLMALHIAYRENI